MPLRTHRDEQPMLNMTPMIDIVFLLIIFFMVGTEFSNLERNIDLQPPTVSDASALTPPPDHRIVNVYRDGRIVLDREGVSLEELTNRLTNARSQYKDLGVQVRGDAASTLQTVTEVLTACRQAGITEMGISVRIAR